jgi:hypothetical protein
MNKIKNTLIITLLAMLPSCAMLNPYSGSVAPGQIEFMQQLVRDKQSIQMQEDAQYRLQNNQRRQ